MAYFAARSSFREAMQDVREALGVEVSASEFARTAHEEGARVEEIQRREDELWLRPASPERPAPRGEI